MGHLQGLPEYLKEMYHISIFDKVLKSKLPWEFHLHSNRIVRARIVENLTYDLKLAVDGADKEELPKIEVKFLYPMDQSDSVKPIIKTDKKVSDLGLEPIVSQTNRYFIKNKSLFPLMKEKRVVFFTLLEGEIVRGIIVDFSRYDITVKLKGGIPITIMRHSIYDLQDKKGCCFLKSVQEKQRDWEKSELFVS